MTQKSSQSNKFVGIKRADGTVYKLLNEEDLRSLMLDHIHGWMDINAICKKYKITKTQFHRQRYYRDRVLKGIMDKVEKLLEVGCASDVIAWILNIPLEHMNKIIITINDSKITKEQRTAFDIYD